MSNLLYCQKCKRATFKQLDANGKWSTLDHHTGNPHYLICHSGPPKYKEYDKLIVFWPKSTKTYTLSMIKDETNDYWLTEHLTGEHKVLTFNKLEDNAKLMDKIYELLYL